VTIIDNPPDDDETVVEEAFGPVLPMLRFADVDEVIRRANASPYGLAASIWTKDLNLAADVANRLECGTVWINEAHHMSPLAPFGGHKQSGYGVENGIEGLHQYSNTRTVVRQNDVAADA
jgi:acyl-CoA reductase-like NAD-dependent aldehyde dehydrogenase